MHVLCYFFVQRSSDASGKVGASYITFDLFPTLYTSFVLTSALLFQSKIYVQCMWLGKDQFRLDQGNGRVTLGLLILCLCVGFFLTPTVSRNKNLGKNAMMTNSIWFAISDHSLIGKVVQIDTLFFINLVGISLFSD